MNQVALDLGEFRLGQRRTDHSQRLHSHILPESTQGTYGIGRQAAEDLLIDIGIILCSVLPQLEEVVTDWISEIKAWGGICPKDRTTEERVSITVLKNIIFLTVPVLLILSWGVC